MKGVGLGLALPLLGHKSNWKLNFEVACYGEKP